MVKTKKTKSKKKTAVAKKSTPLKSKKVAVKKTAIKKKVAKKSTQKAAVKSKKKVSAIPKGYNSVTPYLIVNQATKAIDFYKKVFGAKEVMRMDKPDGRVGHAELKIGDSKIMLADECPEMNAHAPKGMGDSAVSIHLYVKDVDTIVKNAVAAGAKQLRAPEDMFYGDRCGGIMDPFGHQWYISTHIEDVTKAQMKKRAAALYGKKS